MLMLDINAVSALRLRALAEATLDILEILP